MTDTYWRDRFRSAFTAGIGAVMLWYGLGCDKKEEACETSSQVTYHNVTPYHAYIERRLQGATTSLEQKITGNLQEPHGLVEEIKQIYYRDVGEAVSFSGLIHDGVGIAGAVALGFSSIENKFKWVCGSYTFMMAPEMINLYNANISGKDFFVKGGKDLLMTFGAFALGKLIGYFRDSGRRRFSLLDEVVEPAHNARTWWNG